MTSEVASTGTGGPGGRDAATQRWAVPIGLERAASWAWRIAIVAVAAYGGLWLFGRLRVVVIAAVIALVASSGLAPAVGWLQRRRIPRLVATWMVLLGLVGVLAGITALVVPRFIDELDGVGERLTQAIDDGKQWLQDGPLGLTGERVDELEQQARDGISEGASGALPGPVAGLSLAIEALTGLFLAVALTFFFTKDGARMWEWSLARVRPERRGAVDLAGHRSIRAVQGWLQGVAITGVVDAALIGGGLLVLGVPLAFALAVLTFFGAFFPIVGATVAGAVAVLVALVANGFGDAVAVGVIVLVVQQVEGDVILPMVMSRTVALHPAVVLVALATGGAAAGIVGALVAVPATAALVAAGGALRESAAATTTRPDRPPGSHGQDGPDGEDGDDGDDGDDGEDGDDGDDGEYEDDDEQARTAS